MSISLRVGNSIYRQADDADSYEDEGLMNEPSREQFDKVVVEEIGRIEEKLRERSKEIEDYAKRLRDKADSLRPDVFSGVFQEFVRQLPDLHAQKALPPDGRAEIMHRLNVALNALHHEEKVVHALDPLKKALSWLQF